jgi:hypothetical protein
MSTSTVNVACPRCAADIVCTLEIKGGNTGPKPGGIHLDVSANVVDLAARFADHYEAAGHITAADKLLLSVVDCVAPGRNGVSGTTGTLIDGEITPIGVDFVKPWLMTTTPEKELP